MVGGGATEPSKGGGATEPSEVGEGGGGGGHLCHNKLISCCSCATYPKFAQMKLEKRKKHFVLHSCFYNLLRMISLVDEREVLQI